MKRARQEGRFISKNNQILLNARSRKRNKKGDGSKEKLQEYNGYEKGSKDVAMNHKDKRSPRQKLNFYEKRQ